MRIAVVHGYFLSDSGSGIYVRELSRQLALQGHDVTLVCQEQAPEDYGFIDSVWVPDGDGGGFSEVVSRAAVGEGRCRMVRPDIGGKLLVYVDGPFEGFDARTFQDATDEEIEDYAQANTHALASILREWPQDLVIAHHTIMQPYAARRGLEAIAADTPYVVTVHGSSLSFSVKEDPRLAPYAAAGLDGAAMIAALSDFSRNDVVGWAREHGVEISDRVSLLPPGVDVELFRPVKDRAAALARVAELGVWPQAKAMDATDGDILVFAGRLLWTKGAQYAVAALPFVLARRPDAHLVIGGDGPAAEPLRRLIALLDAGDIEAARELTEVEKDLRGAREYGPVLPQFDGAEEAQYRRAASQISSRTHFIGHVGHELLAPVFAAADASLAPSVFAEAFALVSVEALSSGAVPLATYQTGLMAPMDVVAEELEDPACCRLAPGVGLTRELADATVHALEQHPTKDLGFRERLHAIAEERFSWAGVARRYVELLA